MSKSKLTWETLGNLGAGALRLAWDAQAAGILADCENRPALDKKRTIALIIEIDPLAEITGNQVVLKGANVEFKINTKLPGVTTVPTTCVVGKDGALYFDDDVPDAGDDPTIMDEAQRAAQERRDQVDLAREQQKPLRINQG